MGTDFAPPYANISVGYLEETKLYDELSKHFTKVICKNKSTVHNLLILFFNLFMFLLSLRMPRLALKFGLYLSVKYGSEKTLKECFSKKVENRLFS